MDFTKKDMKFIKTDSTETARKLRYMGFTELTPSNSQIYIFINNGKMTFDAEANGCVYTNILCI